MVQSPDDRHGHWIDHCSLLSGDGRLLTVASEPAVQICLREGFTAATAAHDEHEAEYGEPASTASITLAVMLISMPPYWKMTRSWPAR